MTHAVLYVNEFGKASIDAKAVMDSAIKLVFETTDPEDIDLSILSRIDRAHIAVLSVAMKVIANEARRVENEATSIAPPEATQHIDEPSLVPSFETVSELAETEALPTEELTAFNPSDEPDDIVEEFLPDLSAVPKIEHTSTETVAKTVSKPKRIAKRRAESPLLRRPVQETLPLEEARPAKPSTKDRSKKGTPVLNRRSTDKTPAKAALPRRLSKKEDALKMDTIVCLEDGQKVVDLGRHLESIGMTAEEYKKKWQLSDSYPMLAPNAIQKRGIEYEYDHTRKRMIRTV